MQWRVAVTSQFQLYKLKPAGAALAGEIDPAPAFLPVGQHARGDRDHVVPFAAFRYKRLFEALLRALVPFTNVELLLPPPVLCASAPGPRPVREDLPIHLSDKREAVDSTAAGHPSMSRHMAIMRRGAADVGHAERLVNDLVHAREHARESHMSHRGVGRGAEADLCPHGGQLGGRQAVQRQSARSGDRT
jgi:hypothetical protein